MSLSGAAWVARFPTHTDTTSLVGTFRTNTERFLAALRAAGARTEISATFRPPERAYLMHYAYRIAREGLDPTRVPAYPGVDIQWVHRDGTDHPDLAASRAAARAMVHGYAIVHRPALHSRHTEGLAIDVAIHWTGHLTVTKPDGTTTTIQSAPHSGQNRALHALGRSYGVIKLVTDPPHWSSDGH